MEEGHIITKMIQTEGPLTVWYVAPHKPNRLMLPQAKLSVTQKPKHIDHATI
jgi:hypothetical protein